MNLSQIQYFLAASDTLNFTAAAKSLYISQPALSKQIKLLEAELGVMLFCREKGKVRLTRAGESFRGDLAAVLRELDRAVANVSLLGKKQGGRLRIGCFQGTAIDDLIYLISERYRQTQPETELVFRRGGFSEIRSALMDGEADVILTIDFDAAGLQGFRSQVICTKKLAFVYSEKSPLAAEPELSAKSFAGVPLLVLSAGADRDASPPSLPAFLKKLGLAHQKIEAYGNWDTLLTYLKMGRGFAVMLDGACGKISGLRQFLPPPEDFRGSVVAVWKNDSPMTEEFVHNLQLLAGN